jgi:hypothetical protein
MIKTDWNNLHNGSSTILREYFQYHLMIDWWVKNYNNSTKIESQDIPLYLFLSIKKTKII